MTTLSQTGNKDSATKLVDNLAQYVAYQVEDGRKEIEVSRDLSAKLASMQTHLDLAAAVRSEKPAAAVPAVAAGDTKSDGSGGGTTGDGLRAIAAEVSGCTKCSLHKTRTKTVPGQGAQAPEIMFVGEAPGEDEDLQGLAFVGRAGQLLTKMITAMGFSREEVFIGNILKCRPPGNRTPLPEEMQTCLPYLKAQIALLKPKVIIALGATAVRGLTGLETGITKLRGKWLVFENIDLMPTYHPAYLLRNPSAKREVWEDLKEALAKLGRTPPPVKKG